MVMMFCAASAVRMLMIGGVRVVVVVVVGVLVIVIVIVRVAVGGMLMGGVVFDLLGRETNLDGALVVSAAVLSSSLRSTGIMLIAAVLSSSFRNTGILLIAATLTHGSTSTSIIIASAVCFRCSSVYMTACTNTIAIAHITARIVDHWMPC